MNFITKQKKQSLKITVPHDYKNIFVLLAIVAVTALAIGLITLGALISGPMRYDDYGTNTDMYYDYEFGVYEGNELADTLSETLIWVWGFLAVLIAFLGLWGIAYALQHRKEMHFEEEKGIEH